MGRSVAFMVTGDVYAAFSPNRYVSGWEHRRRVTAWRQRAWGQWYKVGAVQLTPPVRINITVYRGREVDSDNLVACVKSLIDSLTPMKRGPMAQACLPDDSRKTVTETRVQGVFDARWKGREWVHVHVIEAQLEEEKPSRVQNK